MNLTLLTHKIIKKMELKDIKKQLSDFFVNCDFSSLSPDKLISMQETCLLMQSSIELIYKSSLYYERLLNQKS